MGEVRKRKVSEEQVNGKREALVVEKSGGLGIISVVLISAVLAGSGCHVIKKDTDKSLSQLNQFIEELKDANAATASLVGALKSDITSKEQVIESLKITVKKSEAEAKELNDHMNTLTNKIDNADENIMERIEIKNKENMKFVHELASHIDMTSETVKTTQDKIEDNDRKMESMVRDIKRTHDATNGAKTKISELEKELISTKKESDTSVGELKHVVGNLPGELRKELARQGVEIESFTGRLSILDKRLTEHSRKITDNELSIAKGGTFESEIRTVVVSLQSGSEAIKSDLIEVSSKIPSQVTMVKMQTQAEKASVGLDEALEEISRHNTEINNLKQGGEKQLSDLSDVIHTLNGNSAQHTSAIRKIQDSIESSSKIISALSGDIDTIKKRQGDIVKQAKQNQE